MQKLEVPPAVVFSWLDSGSRGIIRAAARNAPAHLRERLEEEWLAAAAEHPGPLSRLNYALGCCRAAVMIARDPSIANAPVTCSATWGSHMTAYAYRAPRLLARKSTTGQGPVVCDINITPLIDVMLVLLVTLIVSLPIMTHAVKLDLPQTTPSPDAIRPEVVNLDIEFDGTVAWNGTVVTGAQQLESYLKAAARKDPQPEVHLHADRHVKYDFVAQVLALAQRNRVQKMGFVNTGEFGN